MDQKQYNLQQIQEAFDKAYSSENMKAYRESTKIENPSARDLAMFYLLEHAKEYGDKHQMELDLSG